MLACPGRTREPGSDQDGRTLVEEGLDALREGVPGPVQTALHRSQVHAGDLADLLVALPFELTEPKDQAMVLRELLHRVFDQPPEVALPIQVVGTHAQVLELQWAVVVFPRAGEALEENEDDLTTRLVYADWLDDQGEHEEADRQRKYVASVRWLMDFAKKHGDDFNDYFEGFEECEDNLDPSYACLMFFLRRHVDKDAVAVIVGQRLSSETVLLNLVEDQLAHLD